MIKDKLMESAQVVLNAEQGSDAQGQAIVDLIKVFAMTSVAVDDRDVYNQINHAVLNTMMLLMRSSEKSKEEDADIVAMTLAIALDMWVKLISDFTVNKEPLEDMKPMGGVQ